MGGENVMKHLFLIICTLLSTCSLTLQAGCCGRGGGGGDGFWGGFGGGFIGSFAANAFTGAYRQQPSVVVVEQQQPYYPQTQSPARRSLDTDYDEYDSIRRERRRQEREDRELELALIKEKNKQLELENKKLKARKPQSRSGAYTK